MARRSWPWRFFILGEAYGRLFNPPEVQGAVMMAIAVGGLGVNLVGLKILGSARQGNLNVRGAWLHVLSDTLGSGGAIIAGALVWALGWNLADPIVSALIAVLIVYSSWRLLGESVAVLMETAPRGIDVDEVQRALAGLEEVVEIHDLHIWTITSGMDSLSAHAVIAEGGSPAAVLSEVRRLVHERFGIHHVTIQIEPWDYDGRCRGCDTTRVCTPP